MATEHGILQALWGEVRPAVEARIGTDVRRFVAVLKRRKTVELLALMAETLAGPAGQETEALQSLAKRALGPGAKGLPADAPSLRRIIWSELRERSDPRWANCRLLLDDPLPDRIWLFRHGRWIFYRWLAGRFIGATVAQVEEEVNAGKLSAAEAMLILGVGGAACPNPKLLPAFAEPSAPEASGWTD